MRYEHRIKIAVRSATYLLIYRKSALSTQCGSRWLEPRLVATIE